MDRTLTIGIPCFNEALTIGKVVDDFREVFPEARILVIDNASTDDTAAVARAHGADVVTEPRKGKGHAVQRLFSETRSTYLIMVDGDDTYPASEAPKLIAVADQTGADTVVGVRVSDDRQAFKPTHTLANRLLAWTAERAFGGNCRDLFSGYRLFTRTFYRSIPLLSTGFEVETELTLQTVDKGFRAETVDIAFRQRPEGSHSKLHTFRDGWRVIRMLARIARDLRPLQFFGTASLLLIVLAGLAGFFPVLDYVEYRYVYRVPLAILATGLVLSAGISVTCGLLLDTIVRHRREEFLIRLRRERE